MKVALIAGIVTFLLVPTVARCAPMGSPANSAGKENYAITVEYETQNKKVEDEDYSSWRWLTRVAWGPHDKVDLYARIGATNLKVDMNTGQTFNGDPSAAYGLGIRYATPVSVKHNVLILGDFQYLGFTCKGSVGVEAVDDTGAVYIERLPNKYWWGEYQLSAMVVWQRPIWIPYAGVGITWVNGKADNLLALGADREISEFSEGPVGEFVFGMDLPLKGTAKFSWEARYGGERVSYFMGLNELWH